MKQIKFLKRISNFRKLIPIVFMLAGVVSFSNEASRLNTFWTGAILQQTVTGSIVAVSDGIPLNGVNVIEQGTTNGVVTDFDGNYSIRVSQGAILEFSYLGFKTQTIAVNNQSQINVEMIEDLSQLEEVVVVGYGTQVKKDLTGAIATIKEEDFTPGVNANASDLLKGTAAGVQVSSASSAPGDAPVVRIRGAGSINSSNGVLYVVDGLPGISPNDLSPGDIESIEVLKDASAASIYGTRAANGVILITTKKGKKGKAVINYSTYSGIQSVPEVVDVLGGEDYKRLLNARQVFRGEDVIYTEDDINSTDINTNWQDEIFKSAFVQNHQLGISGGSDTGNYYVGLNYFGQEGVVLNTGTQKYNIRTNVQSEPLDNLKLSLGVNYTQETINSAYSQNTDGGLISSAIRATPLLPPTLDPETGRYFDVVPTAQDNPLAFINGRDDENVRRRFYATFNTDYEFVDNLTATLRLGAESNNSRRDIYSNRLSNGGLTNGGAAQISTGESVHWLIETLLTYKNTFAEKHDFSVLGGATWERFDDRGFAGSSRGFISDVLGTNSLQSGDGDEGDNVSSSRSANQLNGFLGRMTYGFDDRYLLTASFRVDGSSRFAADNRYAFFPSASVGWRIDQEEFLKNVDWIDQFKVRLGYGELGNQGINNFETRQTLVPGGNSVFGGAIVQGVVPARLPNPDLTWETTAETNFGLDFGFANNRISGSIDYYDRETRDQLFNKPLPSTVGFGSVRTNIGKVRNSGIDFTLNTKNFDKDNFSWDTSIILSYLKNETIELPEFTEQIIGGSAGNFISGYYIIEEGSPIFSYYGYTIERLFQEGDDIENTPTPADGFRPGMPVFKDVNEDGIIDADDRAIIGNPFPEYTFGFRNTFTYKNLTLDVFVNGVQNVDTFSNDVAESIYPINTSINSLSRFFIDRWTPENTNTLIPSGENYSLYAGALAVNNLTVVDASYVRLKNVTIAYNIPLKESLISNLRVYLAGENLATWTDFEGYDPEASISGGNVNARSYNSYPLARIYRLGLDIKF